MKYTALDLIKLTGISNAEEKLGKVSIDIGGVNVNRDKVINVNSDEIVVRIGADSFPIAIPAEQSEEHAENVRKAKEEKGRASTAEFEKRKGAPPAPSE